MKYNIDNRLKDTAIVNLTDFLNVIDLYEDDETEKALELCIGLITLGLGGTFETDDREIKRLLRNRQYTVSKSNTAYCNKVNFDELKQKNKLQLDDIAEMMANGATQQIIADTLCVSLDTIKYRVRVMNVKQMISQIWCADGKSWSQRVWNDTERLQQSLNDRLIDCVITGKKTTQLNKFLQEEFNVSYNRADTIIRTEIAHIQTQAARQRYKDYGIREVEIYADTDNRTCPICSQLDGKRYGVDDALPIPAHPRCRCCVVPVVDSRITEQANPQPAELTNGAKNDNIVIPKDMYKQDARRLKKSIKSYHRMIDKHEYKIQHPEEFYPDWNEVEPDIQEGRLGHWKKEIILAKRNLAAAEKMLRERSK